MKLYIKNLLIILCLVTSTYSLAKSYKGEAPPPKPVVIPIFKGGLELSLSALWMEPSSSNLDYLDFSRNLSTMDPTISNIQTYNVAINPNNNWGFIFDIGYVFPNTANDVRLEWMAFHSSYDSDFSLLGSNGLSTEIFLYPLTNIFLPDEGSGATAAATMNYKLDAVDLTFGQYLDIYSRIQTRIFTGLRYARIDSDMTTQYSTVALNEASFYTYDQISSEINSSFNGLGPMLGIRADFALGKGFGLAGAIDGALLVSQIGFNANQFTQEITSGVLSKTYTDLSWDPVTVIAPSYDAKFGINYQYLFSNGTVLAFELGYQVTKYYDVIEQIDRGDAASPERLDTDVVNFDLNGVYLTAHVKI